MFTFAPLAASSAMAAVNAGFRSTHPRTPNDEAALFGGMLGAISFLIGFHIVFFERRRPERYSKAWHRFFVAIILWVGGCAMMALNVLTAKPR